MDVLSYFPWQVPEPPAAAPVSIAQCQKHGRFGGHLRLDIHFILIAKGLEGFVSIVIAAKNEVPLTRSARPRSSASMFIPAVPHAGGEAISDLV